MENDRTDELGLSSDRQSSAAGPELGHPAPPSRFYFEKPFLLTSGLLLVSTFTIPIATIFLWDLPFGSGTLQLLLCVFLGPFLALPILLSIWAALGSQTWLVRIPFALSAELFLLCVYFGTIETLSATPPQEVYWIFSIVALSVSVAAQIPMWVLRIWGGVQIGRGSNGLDTRETQFSITHLFIATTVAALLIPLAQWLISIGSDASGGGPTIAIVAGFCGIFISVMGLLTMLSLLIVFVPRLRGWSIGILLTSFLIFPFAVASVLPTAINRKFSTPELSEAALNVAAFSVSHSITLILVLGLYYALGFRIKRKARTG